jgi:DNA-binding NtrC family response regulator
VGPDRPNGQLVDILRSPLDSSTVLREIHDAMLAPVDDDTLEEQEGRARRERRERRTFLFIALEGDRPFAGGARYALDGIDEVVVGRGPERLATRQQAGSGRRLDLRLPGRAVSALHARLLRTADGWGLEDAHSTNGSYVNGVRVEHARLGPNDVVEIGRTFLFVEEHEASALAPVDLDSRDGGAALPGFPTLSPELDSKLADVRRVASSDISVAIAGETGSGKEVLARAISAASARRRAFIAVNCAAISENLTEAQLFGHVRGAFSGAVSDAIGFVRAANGGTLLLDEVQELRPSAQAALLRVLQEREVVPVGGVQPIAVDARVIAASSTPLDRATQEGRFRPDLFARLAGYSVKLPPLRERRMDLGLLIAALLSKLSVSPTDQPRIAPGFGQRLVAHGWPLNVRELEQALRRAWVLSVDGVLDDDSFLDAPLAVPSAVSARGPAGDEHDLRRDALSVGVGSAPSGKDAQRDARDLELLIQGLNQHDGHLGKGCEHAGISRQRGHRLLLRYPERDPRR